MKRDPNEDQRIALFIDFENLVTRTGLDPDSFDLQPALDVLLEKGKVVFRRAYADWTRFAGATKRLHDHGVEMMDVPPSTRAGKNGADVRLVIDALELAYLREHIDTFVIASGDSDFCPLAAKLRENDRTVIGMAVKESTSPLFVKACDEFVYLRAGGQRRRGGEHARATAAGRPGEGEGEGEGGREGRPGGRPRGGLGHPRARHRAGEPLRHQGGDRPARARLRRARSRLLVVLPAPRAHGEGRAPPPRAGREGAVVRAAAGLSTALDRGRRPGEPTGGSLARQLPRAPAC